MRFYIQILALALVVLQVQSRNSCGTSYQDSKKCKTACPSGTDGECPSGERCYANVPCSGQTPTTGKYCGRSYQDSKKCKTACPSGVDRECPSGERCFANVPCSQTGPGSGGGPTPGPGPSPGGFVVSETQFKQLFPLRDRFYTYQGLVNALSSFPAFANTGDQAVKKREAAAFLANVAHETGDLRYIREINVNTRNSYCDANTALQNGFTRDCFKNGKRFQYYGRGPIQLSWNFNYLAAGKAIGRDLLHNPDLVATNAAVAWSTAIWYWMTQKGPGTMTPHAAIVGGKGFGETIRSINGALECGGRNPATVTKRVNNFLKIIKVLGTTQGPGNLRC